MKLSVERICCESSVDNWIPPDLSHLFVALGVFILIFGLFPLARGTLVLLGDVILELLITVMGSNFAGWLFFHASYFEKANAAKKNGPTE